MRVCIDPGHGGIFPGATGNGYDEKDLTLKLSLELKEYFDEHGIDVVMTRKTDVTLKSSERINKIESSNADICLSIHFNVFNCKANGAETIYQIGNNDSKNLAEVILNELGELGLEERRVYSKPLFNDPNTDYYFILRDIRPITSVIVECLFIDNEQDIQFIQNNNSFKKLAEAIGDGVLKHFGFTDIQEHWSQKHFEKLYNLDLLNDYYNPEDIPTWGELATMISKTIDFFDNQNNKNFTK